MSILINGTCKDCAHWAPALDDTLRGILDDVVANCLSPRVSAGHPAGIVVTTAGAMPATGPRFGCIHWKAKP